MPALRNNILGLFAIVAVMICVSGCGYPEVSPQTYALAKSLYSACNRQNEEQLAKVEELVAISLDKAEISKREAKLLREIIATAHADEWKDAMLDARRLLEDQVEH